MKIVQLQKLVANIYCIYVYIYVNNYYVSNLFNINSISPSVHESQIILFALSPCGHQAMPNYGTYVLASLLNNMIFLAS